MNKFFIWFIFFFVSITLGIAVFDTGQNKNNNNQVTINNHIINEDSLLSLEMAIKKKNLEKSRYIINFDTNIRKIIINNINNNKNLTINCSKDEILKVIISQLEFAKKNKFDYKLYKTFIEERKIPEYIFHKFIEKKVKSSKKISLIVTKKDNYTCKKLKLNKNISNNFKKYFDISNLEQVNYMMIRPSLFNKHLIFRNDTILKLLIDNEKLYKSNEILKISHIQINKRHKKYNKIKQYLLNNPQKIVHVLKNKKVKNITVTSDELNAKFKYKIKLKKNLYIKENKSHLHIIKINGHDSYHNLNYRNEIRNAYNKNVISKINNEIRNSLIKYSPDYLKKALCIEKAEGLMFIPQKSYLIQDRKLLIFFNKKENENINTKLIMPLQNFKENILLQARSLFDVNKSEIYANKSNYIQCLER